MLLLTLFLSIPLAWIAHCRRDASTTRQTLREVQERGGNVYYYESNQPEFLYELLGRMPRVAYIDFPEQCDFSETDLAYLEMLPEVPGLSLRNTAVTHNGFSRLKSIPGLERLDLRDTQLDDESVKWLQEIKNLEALDARNTSISDVGVDELAHISTLRVLHLAGRKISDQGILTLESHPNLELLNLSDSLVTDKGIAVAATLPRLKTLFFARTAVTDEGLRAIQAAPALQLIAANGSGVGENWITLMRPKISWRPYGTNESDPYPEVLYGRSAFSP